LDSSNSITNSNNIAPIDDKLNTHLDDYEVFDEYDENIEPAPTGTPAINEEKKVTNYTGVHSTGFKDFLLKNELNRAINECGFEQPSAV
jgi:hypothetical protein